MVTFILIIGFGLFCLWLGGLLALFPGRRPPVAEPEEIWRRCQWCRNETDIVCDHELSPGRDCDAPVCYRHRHADGEKDYCPRHRPRPAPSTRIRSAS
jgi:hypothetical protein